MRRSKKSWFINAFLFYVLKFYPLRRRNCWIFGCWEGNKYDDNSRYLFEYVNKYHPEIDAIWLTASEDIVKQVNAEGHTAYLFSSRKGKHAQLHAGVAFYTNGLDDFGDICFVYGAKIVALWHGVGIKNIYYAGKRRDYYYWKNRLIDLVFSWTYRDYTVSSSEESDRFFMESLLVSEKSIVKTGFPRNDVFRYNLKPADVLTYADANQYRYILYMPTYRGYLDNTISDTIKSLVSDETFLSYLNANNIRFLIKKHYLTNLEDIELPSMMYVVEEGDFSSTQELLAIADLLITDYSSCITDFALTGKPSLLYSADIVVYRQRVGIISAWNPIYDDFGINGIGDLKSNIVDALQREDSLANRTTECIRLMYECEEVKDSCYCENVFRAVGHKVGFSHM